MSLRNLFIQLGAEWPAFHSLKIDDKSHPTHALLRQTLPNEVKASLSDPSELMVVGGGVQGNISAAPWVGVFHTSLTESAQNEYYVVYLLSVDFRHLVLEIGFGATQFAKRFGENKTMMTELRSASTQMQASAQHLVESYLSANCLDRISLNPADLASGGPTTRQHAYEQGAIYHLSYELNDLPDDVALTRDLNELVSLYRAMAESPLIPSVFDLAWDSSPPSILIETPEDADFEPLERQKRGAGSSAKKGTTRPRRSKLSHKVGRAAEEYVFERQKQKLRDLGRPDLADCVIWHLKCAEDRTPGWDITSFDESGDEIYVEVKGSEGKKISSVNLTPKEWRKAKEPRRSDRYYIYLVHEALTKPSTIVLRNPAKWVSDGTLEITTSEYLLDLRTP